MFYRTEMNFRPSGLGRVSMGLGGRGLDGTRGWGWGRGGWTLGDGTDIHSDGRSFKQTDACLDGQKFPPLFYRTSSPSGPLPKMKKW